MIPRITILGMGNVLMGDDGAGPYTVATLTARYQLPSEIEVLDIGTPGLDLVPYLSDLKTLILVDTVYSDAPAGAIRTYDQQALLSQKVPPRLSPHDPALGQCLCMLEIEGKAPTETVLVGIVPKSSALGPGLSPDVQAAIPAAMDRVVQELESRGFRVPLRQMPLQPDLWWEA